MPAGKTAIITGSTSGIGLAIASSLAAKGADVVLNSFSDSDADREAASKLAKAHGVKAIYVQADMSKPDECRDLAVRECSRPVRAMTFAPASRAHRATSMGTGLMPEFDMTTTTSPGSILYSCIKMVA